MPQRRNFTQSVPLAKGTEFSVDVISDAEYIPGRPNISQGILEKDITLQATPAEPLNCKITTTQYKYQDITIKVYNSAGTEITREYINPGSIALPFGIKYAVVLTPHEGYIKSELINIIENQIYTLNRNINISAVSEAEPYQCEIMVEPTMNQTITVTTDADSVIESDPDDEVILVTPYWTHYLPTVEPDPGYKAGVINSIGEQIICRANINFTPLYPEDPGNDSGRVTVRVSAATEYKQRVTLYKYQHQKIKVTSVFNGEETIITVDEEPIESTDTYNIYELFDSSTYKITLIPNEGYQALYPIIRYIEDGEIHTIDVLDQSQIFILDKPIDILAYSDASISYYNITLIQSQDQTMYLSSGEYEDVTGSVNLAYNSEFIIRVVVDDPSRYDAGEVISTFDDLELIDTNIYKGVITGDNTIYITPVTIRP